jgi:hypothetical protein
MAYTQPNFPIPSSTGSVTPTSQRSMEYPLPFAARGDRTWSPSHPPMRSMSLAAPEELPQYYQTQYVRSSTDELERHMRSPSSMQSNTVGRNVTPMDSTPQSIRSYTVPYHNASTQNMRYGYSPIWSSVPPSQSPQTLTRGSEGFPQGWYLEPTGLAQVREESPHQQHSSQAGFVQFQPNPGG